MSKKLSARMVVQSVVWEEHCHGRNFPSTLGEVIRYGRRAGLVLLTTVFRPEMVAELRESHLCQLATLCEGLKLPMEPICRLDIRNWDSLIPGGDKAIQVCGTVPGPELVDALGVGAGPDNLANGLFLLQKTDILDEMEIVYSWIAENPWDKPTQSEFNAISATVERITNSLKSESR